MATVLAQANERLQTLRNVHPEAGGLVIAMDQAHAVGIAELLRKLGTRAVVAVSDDPGASDRITRFSESSEPWIVAVRMVSEGAATAWPGGGAATMTSAATSRRSTRRTARTRPIRCRFLR